MFTREELTQLNAIKGNGSCLRRFILMSIRSLYQGGIFYCLNLVKPGIKKLQCRSEGCEDVKR